MMIAPRAWAAAVVPDFGRPMMIAVSFICVPPATATAIMKRGAARGMIHPLRKRSGTVAAPVGGRGRIGVQAGSIVKRKSDDALFRNEEVVVLKYSLGLLRATSLRSVYV